MRELTGDTRIRLSQIKDLKAWHRQMIDDGRYKIGTVNRWNDGKLHEKTVHGWRVLPTNGSAYEPGTRTTQNKSFSGYNRTQEERKQSLIKSSPIEISTSAYKGKTEKEIKQLAKSKYSKLKPVYKDGIKVIFKPMGYNETKSHSADKNVLYVLGDMDKLVKESTFMFEEPNSDPRKTNTLNVFNYAVKTRIDGNDYYTRIVIREDKDGNFYYDNDSTEVEKVKADVDILLPSSQQKGFIKIPPYVSRVPQWLAGVKLKVNNKHDKKRLPKK